MGIYGSYKSNHQRHSHHIDICFNDLKEVSIITKKKYRIEKIKCANPSHESPTKANTNPLEEI